LETEQSYSRITRAQHALRDIISHSVSESQLDKAARLPHIPSVSSCETRATAATAATAAAAAALLDKPACQSASQLRIFSCIPYAFYPFGIFTAAFSPFQFTLVITWIACFSFLVDKGCFLDMLGVGV
jgi:hypothetical protein